MANKFRGAAIFIIIIMITFGNFGGLAQPPGDEETKTLNFEGYCEVGSSVEESFKEQIPIGKLEFELIWEDDEGSDSEPDTLSLTTSDGMHEPKSDSGSGGTVTITWDEHGLNDTWDMAVTCESAGPTQEPVTPGPFGLITQDVEDPGNSWTLTVTIIYSSGGGGPPPRIQDVLASPIFKVHVALMIMSVFLFLGTGLVAGVFLYSRKRLSTSGEQLTLIQKLFITPFLLILLVIVTFIVFFMAAVPIGMWIAGMMYGSNKAWTGFPAIWNPEAFDMTNADNVSFIALFLWFIPMYLNRAQILRSKYFKKLFGWSKFAMARAEKAPNPRLSNKELALSYFFMGIFIFVVFEVQPHG